MAPLLKRPVILYAEDDDVDFQLVAEALKETPVPHTLLRFRDGGELLDYLFARGAHAGRRIADAPHVLLLDLDMPGMSGEEVLGIVRSDPCLRRMPVIVLTGTEAEGDVLRIHELGVNSFMRKPLRFEELRRALAAFEAFWLGTAEVPPLTGLPEPAPQPEPISPESD